MDNRHGAASSLSTDIGLLQARAMALPGKTRAEQHAVYRKSLKTRAQSGDLLCYIEYVHGGKHADIRSFVRSPHARVMADHLAKGPRTLMVSHPESGKGLALDTPLPCPAGWTTMGEVMVGDELFSSDGALTRVVFVSETHNRPCYRVTFSDGESIVCDDQHRWLTRTRVPQHGMSVKTMDGILQRVLTIEGRANHGVPVARALDLPPQLLPLDPYVLGVWLGDGSTLSGSVTNIDQGVWDNISALGYNLGESLSAGKSATTRTVYGLQATLRNLGLRGNKRIPTRYLRASAAQRQALLEGLMDTDGYCGKRGNCEFTSTLEGLATDTLELLRSLGHKARLYHGRATLNGTDHGPKYRVLFMPRTPVFSLERKKCRQLADVPNDRDRWLTITSIEEVDSVPTRCIQVDHPSHLFVAGPNMIITHNSLLHRSEMEMWLGIQTELAFNAGGTVPSALYVMGTLDKQAKPQVLDVRGTLEFNRHYKELYPSVAPDKAMGWEKDLFFLKRPDEKRRPEPTLMATGCEGDVQGMRFGKILVDDPISQKDAKSPTIVHDRVVWILATLERRVIEGGEIRYVFTRWHERDAFPQLSRITPTLAMPVYGFWEAHPEYGITADTLWPAKWPRERVEVERNKLIDTGEAGLWSLVWGCNPQQAEGGIVKRAWLRWAASPLEREPIIKEEETEEVVL